MKWNYAVHELDSDTLRTQLIDTWEPVVLVDAGYSLWVGTRRVQIRCISQSGFEWVTVGYTWAYHLKNQWRRLWYRIREWTPWAMATMLSATVVLALASAGPV